MTARRRGAAAGRPQESPLAWLHARRDADGCRMIDDLCYAAGERLRRDFALASLAARTTMDWTALALPVHHDPAGGGVLAGGAAGAARDRVFRALEAVGPELSGPLVDVCGLDRGLPEMERRRGWPARAGKVVLRLALSALARHYGLSNTARGPSAGRTRHWGAADYRPGRKPPAIERTPAS